MSYDMTSNTPNNNIAKTPSEKPSGEEQENPHANTDMPLIISEYLESKKISDIVKVPLEGKSSVAEYMILGSASSKRHIKACADGLAQMLKKNYHMPVYIEGFPQCDWVLLDTGDTIIHLFKPEVRSKYNLEALWQDAEPETTTNLEAYA